MIGASLLLFAQASTTVACNDRDAVISYLTQKYHEEPVGAGPTNGGGLIEVWAAKDGSTWTVVLSLPNGLSCPLASGEGWRWRSRHRDVPSQETDNGAR